MPPAPALRSDGKAVRVSARLARQDALMMGHWFAYYESFFCDLEEADILAVIAAAHLDY